MAIKDSKQINCSKMSVMYMYGFMRRYMRFAIPITKYCCQPI